MTPLRCSSSSSPASAAKLFVQLSYTRHGTAVSSSSSILDVLLPRSSLLPPSTIRLFHCGSTGLSRPSFSPTTSSTRPAVGTKPSRSTHTIGGNSRRNDVFLPVLPPRRPHHPHHALLFSTATAMRRTEVIHNPQKDDDGNEMLMEITPRAANRLSKIMAQDKNPDLALRIQVESGGCYGFQYLMSLTTLPPLPPSPSPSSSTSSSSSESGSAPPPSSAEVAAEVTPSTTTSNAPSAPELREDDTVFAFVKDDDQSPAEQGTSSSSGSEEGQQAQVPKTQTLPKIVLDGPSLQLLRDSKVDYTMELIGSQFKIVDNPHATGSCGCGTSFDVKDL